jgi:hypothetical protein
MEGRKKTQLNFPQTEGAFSPVQPPCYLVDTSAQPQCLPGFRGPKEKNLRIQRGGPEDPKKYHHGPIEVANPYKFPITSFISHPHLLPLLYSTLQRQPV